MELTDKMLDAGLKALEKALVKRAVDAIEAHKFELSELPDLVRRLKQESETGQVLIAASYLEDRVKTLITLQLKDVKTKVKSDTVFGSNGPLSTFGSRLTMCYQLSWLSSESLRQITAFRKIRNEFAHRAYRASYVDTEPHRVCRRLQLLRKWSHYEQDNKQVFT